MKIINKTGYTGKIARELKERFTEYHEGNLYGLDHFVDLDKNGGEIEMSFNVTNNGNTWSQATFYYHYTKSGNLVIR